MDADTSWTLAQISVFAGLIPFLVGMYRQKQANRNQRILWLLILLALATELSAYIIGAKLKSNNLYMSHLFTLVELVLLGIIYRRELAPTIAPKTISILIGIFLVFAIYSSIFVETIFQYNGTSRAISSLLIIVFSLVYFYQTLKEMKVERLEREPMFWLSIGLLIYFSASLFIFIFSNYIQPSVKLSYTFWGIHAILNISLYLFYAVALWIKTPKTASR